MRMSRVRGKEDDFKWREFKYCFLIRPKDLMIEDDWSIQILFLIGPKESMIEDDWSIPETAF